MKIYGLIGFPLSHSFSKRYFSDKFETERIHNCRYELFPIEHIDEMPQLLAAQPDLAGLNVTIPHKVSVFRFLNRIDEAARTIGAVNCIAIDRSSGHPELSGYNTDAFGFEQSLVPLLKPHHQNALIFGNGGAAKAVKFVLGKLGIRYRSVVRQPAAGCLTYSELDAGLLATHPLLINTTPLGMSPQTHTAPDIPYHALTPDHLAYDLVYNPEETLFLSHAAKQGSAVKNGLDMLYLQAEEAWRVWNQHSH
ncbi:shikimate dehydrogenase [Pedobacter yulinensis]|uniref:Shikimate dehydrogenase n=1 Tax=Pedobacter yulinensis TaxID=2126353 RepID=A0A2T3HNJ2_9SPHI|nr:shikimate dehydrogenase [Pedobacter yulinensis]PST83996.1 shikimate dehydrogenase [Pedobacter yulinensis]